VLAAGEAADVALAQVVDGCHVERHGRIDTVSSLMLESIDGPSCTMTVRLLPKGAGGPLGPAASAARARPRALRRGDRHHPDRPDGRS
jgi:hypothetical protein